MIINALFSILGTDPTSKMIIVIVKIIILAIELLIMMKIFTKAGKKPILAWIPLVNKGVLLKISGMSSIWVIIPLLSAIMMFFGVIPAVLILEIVNLIIFEIILKIKLANKFRMKLAFAVGLMICPIIFYAILAYGNARYISNWGLKSRE